jgi:hypothetical protein
MHKITRIGDKHVGDAIASGVLGLATLVDNPTWGSSVPTAGYGSTLDSDQSFVAVQTFWSSEKCNTTADGWASIVKNGYATDNNSDSLGTGKLTKTAYTYKNVYDQAFSTELTHWLYSVLNVDEPDLAQYIPSYVKGLITA